MVPDRYMSIDGVLCIPVSGVGVGLLFTVLTDSFDSPVQRQRGMKRKSPLVSPVDGRQTYLCPYFVLGTHRHGTRQGQGQL